MSEDDLDMTLKSWQPPPLAVGFADRVLTTRRARKRSQLVWRGMAAVAVVVLTAIGIARAPRSGVVRAQGTLATHAIGNRGTVVLEPNSELRYRVDWFGRADVEQLHGNVFYRVERGGPFVVTTPAGRVEVKGTCFRVEDLPMNKEKWLGATMGAAAAIAALVTVYEGKVLLANERGSVTLQAGDHGKTSSDDAPERIGAGVSATGDAMHAPAATTTATVDATREQLLRTAEQQRQQIAQLQSQLGEYESAAHGGKEKTDPRSYFAPTKDELQDLAKQCALKWDMPNVDIAPKPITVPADKAAEVGLSDAELTAWNRMNADFNTRSLKQIRALYVEATGDQKGADSLSPWAMLTEVQTKTPEGLTQEVFQRLANERAGIPATKGDNTPLERLMRLYTSSGDTYEKELSDTIGPDLAHKIREQHLGSWNSSRSSTGCPK